MRLTLRTMLAYMDDVLEPADAEILAKKIEESDFASGLLDRIRGVTRKLRMDAPRLDGKGMGNDANTVAEYLDSTLPQDRVAEFERVCLESDKHLCEVAACHQILTLVLGKPADVPPELRDRIYGLAALGSGQAAVHPAAAAAAGGAAVVPPPVSKSNGKSVERAAALEVPEYLRAGRQSSLWPLALAAAIVLLLALGVMRALGPFDAQHPLARMFRSSQPVTTETDTESAAKAEADSERSLATKADDAKSADSQTAPTGTEAASPGATAATTPEASVETPATSTAVAAVPGVTEPPPLVASPVEAASAAAIPPATTPSPADAAPAPISPAIVATPSPSPADTTTKLPETTTPPADTAPKSPMEVGRFTSDGQLIATFDASDGFWYAKAPQEILVAGERMVVLPPYRPQIALPSAVTLTFAGEGSLQMGEHSDSPAPRVVVDYGRFVVATAGRPGAQVELNLAGFRGVLTLADADSVVAIKVMRWLPPGSDPEATDAIPVVEMYNANGRVTWQPIELTKVDIPARHVHVSYGTVPPETHGPFLPPEWMDSKNVRPIDRAAGDTLERMTAADRPLNLTLQEVMKDRRVEMRALAARCLVALGEFEPALGELADPNQYSFWSGQFDALRQALSRGKETAAKLRETIGLLRPAYARDLYRLLWGYGEEQLERGGAAELVRLLEHEQMDVRVLAHLNLVSITGAREFYRPERPPVQMKTAIQSWRDRLSKGAIIHRLPPSPLDVYKPATTPSGTETRSGAPATGPMGSAPPR